LLAKLFGFCAEFVVRELFDLGLEGVDGVDARHQTLDFAFVLGAEDFGYNFVNQSGSSLKGGEFGI
jgi:hypothetical protein